jgi:hypothetical protein
VQYIAVFLCMILMHFIQLHTSKSLYATYYNVCIHDTHALQQYVNLKACMQYITMLAFMILVHFNNTYF